MPNPLERPKKPNFPNQSAKNQNPALQRKPNRPQPHPNPAPGGGNRGNNNNRNRGGGRGGRGGRGRDNNNNPMPNPWLLEEKPSIDDSASFVEYLRWMRESDYQYKDATKVEILHQAQEKSRHYHSRLSTLNQRTKLIADISFEAQSTWRIRVGGHRGPESILLPAFDALGMPYIPSSSLRGVARNYAIRELMENKGLKWKEAKKQIAPYFGSLETDNKANQAGKVVFLDAYPKEGCLEMDMANNIWNWEGNNLKYSPNPNPFLSLKNATFVIGLRLASNCQDKGILEKIKYWLINGLQEGIGSQINSGYGQLKEVPLSKGNPPTFSTPLSKGGRGGSKSQFLRVEIGLQGQLIHGYQKFTQWNQNNHGNWQMRGKPTAEVRSTAFKSMLRYWFRCFGLGVLPANKVQEWEGQLFGSINPQKRGYIQCNILEGKLVQPEPRFNRQGKDDDCGEQSGILTVSYSSETPKDKQKIVEDLMYSLTWMMLNLGGIGQGARRLCYSRENRQSAPWWRGSTFFIDSEEDIWNVADNPQKFAQQFKQKLQVFYSALGSLINQNINPKNLRNNGRVSNRDWQEAIDANGKIVVCSGDEDFNKPYALATLHSQTLKRNGNYDGDLCGKVQGGVKPSPVWIANTDDNDYQVVTVFGATQNPRRRFLQMLEDNAEEYYQIFPFS